MAGDPVGRWDRLVVRPDPKQALVYHPRPSNGRWLWEAGYPPSPWVVSLDRPPPLISLACDPISSADWLISFA